MPKRSSQFLSLIIHVTALLLLYVVAHGPSRQFVLPSPLQPAVHLIAPRLPERVQLTPASGGSNNMEAPARHGTPPPRAARTFVAPPSTVENPRLPMLSTIALDTDVPAINSRTMGDPFSPYANGSLGNRGGNGIGNGHDGPLGDGDGNGPAGSRSASHGPMTPPQLIHQVDPDFSEEARKAKFQGVVVVHIEVDTNGRARNLRVVRSLGLGLDEKALEAVAQWRFRPALREGKPVMATALVEVNFRLL